ncbi:hypothetical protein SBA2_450115 [Acidobacteriia bacterium SbA2]|nr:hypothetical protein SBA2_450115 [Acidobacteriia bacterium SbA2]
MPLWDRLDFFRHNVWGAVAAVAVAQDPGSLFVADYFLLIGIEVQGAADAVGSVSQVQQRGGIVALLDGRVQFFLLAALDAVDEVPPVVAAGLGVGPGFLFLAEPGLVGIVSVHGHIALRAIEDVANGILRSFALGASFRGVAQCRGHIAAAESRRADFRLVIRNPVAYFELHHAPLAVRHIELPGHVERVGRLLVVIEHEVPADGRNLVRKLHSQAPTRHVEFVDALVADVSVPRVPDPMPVVMEPVLAERLHGRRACPEVVVDPRRHWFRFGVADGVPPLVAKAARKVKVSKQAFAHLLHSLDDRFTGAAVCAVLHNPVVLLDGAQQLAALPPVVGKRLFNVNVFARLAAPDGLQRMPVVGCGDRNRVDGFVVQQLAQVDESRRPLNAHLLDFRQALVEHVLIHVAERGEFHVLHVAILFDVRPTLPVQAHYSNTHAVIRAEHALRVGQESNAAQRGHSRPGSGGGPQEFSAVNLFRHAASSHASIKRATIITLPRQTLNCHFALPFRTFMCHSERSEESRSGPWN